MKMQTNCFDEMKGNTSSSCPMPIQKDLRGL